MEKNNLTFIDNLLALLKEGEELGLDLQNPYQKIEQVRETLKDERIKIALLSSFSYGKTSIIAGLNGQVEDNMKIDIDESSDEMSIYHPHGLASGFEIMDTPGLFGTKTKEIKGENIRLSEISERYISEAHIVMYVCHSVTLLKDSHAAFIDKVMRCWGKLENTIFVINKMDETGSDIEDEEEFAKIAEIKKSALVQRMKDTIHLTADEEKKLNIVCIAANPYNKGFDYWFARKDEYAQISHIEDLRKCIRQIVAKSDKDTLQRSVAIATCRDIVDRVTHCATEAIKILLRNITPLNETIQENRQDLNLLRKEITHTQTEMKDRLDALQSEIDNSISTATMATIEDVLRANIGFEGGKVTFSKFCDKINQILKECSEGVSMTINTTAQNVEQRSNKVSNLMMEGISKGALNLQKLNISAAQIKSIRNFIAPSFKFKPWGAVNLSKELGKYFKIGGWLIPIIIDAWSRIQEKNAAKKFAKLQSDLKDAIDHTIADVCKNINDPNSEFSKNVAQAYNSLAENLNAQQKDYDRMQNTKEKLNSFQQHMVEWMKKNAEDVSFETTK